MTESAILDGPASTEACQTPVVEPSPPSPGSSPPADGRVGTGNSTVIPDNSTASATGTMNVVAADRPEVMPYRVKRWVGFDGPSVCPVPTSPLLFEDVRRNLVSHYRFPAGSEWAYDLAALWVMQVYVSDGLSAVFYLLLGGSKGDGKTTLLDLLSLLAGAINASDISVAALVHALSETPDRAVTLDEFDAVRDSERDSALSAIVRNGYVRGKSYIRHNVKTHANEECPTFGAKAIGFRGAVDSALEDRGFPLPCTKYTGPGGFDYVQANDGPSVGNLPARLREWAGAMRETRRLVRAEFKESKWESKVREVVGNRIGANRDSQLASVALQVCRFCCIDLTDSLKAALGLRTETATANTSVSLEEAQEILNGLTQPADSSLKVSEFYVVRQRDFANAVNAKRRERRERPLTSGQIAAIRRDLGVLDSWLSHPQNKTTWNLPSREWDARSKSDDPSAKPNPSGAMYDEGSQGEANPPNLPNLSDTDGGVSRVRPVRLGAPGPDLSDPLCGGPALASRLASAAESRRAARSGFNQGAREEGHFP